MRFARQTRRQRRADDRLRRLTAVNGRSSLERSEKPRHANDRWRAVATRTDDASRRTPLSSAFQAHSWAFRRAAASRPGVYAGLQRNAAIFLFVLSREAHSWAFSVFRV